jgi:glycosyltransferase involved in cell wall biosynthesis
MQGFTFGVFGRLAPEKGVDLAIRASGQTKVGLHIFGEGPELPTLQKLAEGVSAPAVFHSFQSEIADAMNAVDAIVIPSRWAEAFPFSALEAMSLAKPIIAAETGGLPEMVQDGTTGLLFKRDDFNDLALKMTRLKNRAAEAEAMGCRGQERHQREFTVDQMAERIEKVYVKTVGLTHAAPRGRAA